MTTVTITDDRTPVEPAERSPLDAYPVGAFVAYGATVDGNGERRRAIVVAHDAEAGSIDVLDGAETHTVDAAGLTHVVVLADSANAYAQRVVDKANQLAKDYGYQEIVRPVIEELTTTPDHDEEATFNVIVTVTGRLRLRARRGARVMPDNLIEKLRSSVYASSIEFRDSTFRTLETPNYDVTVQLVDELPTSETTNSR